MRSATGRPIVALDARTVRFAVTFADRRAIDLGDFERATERHSDGCPDPYRKSGDFARSRMPTDDRRQREQPGAARRGTRGASGGLRPPRL